MLIFRMEILKVNGPGKRLRKCKWSKISEGEEVSGCDADEEKLWNDWKDKDLSELKSKVDTLTEKSKQTLKKGEIEPIMKELKELKPVLKAREKLEKKKS